MTEASPSIAVPQDTPAARSRIVNLVTVTAAGAAVAVAWIAGQVPGSAAVLFRADGIQNIANVLAPLVLIALFLERAVEVVISSWRDHEADRLEHVLKNATDPTSVAHAQLRLNRYKLDTQRLSFLVSLTLALVAALVGVRAIAPLLDSTAALGAAQALWLMRFDVLITGLLLAGGAEGIHQIVTTFTTFLDSTRKRAEAAAPDGGTPGGGQ